MLRIRLLRILLPLLLAAAAAVLYMSWEPRRSLHQDRAQTRPVPQDPSATHIWFVEYEGERRAVAGDVEHLEEREGGELHLEGIRDLEIHREATAPIIVNAERGDRTGAEGQRVWNFSGGVVFRETERGLVLRLPYLEIDEAAGEARSAGDIQLEGPGLHGRAEALVYGLEGQPTRLTRPQLEDASTGHISAREGLLHEGTSDIELTGEVVVIQDGERLDAGRMRLRRGANETIEHVDAGDDVWGSWPVQPGLVVGLRATELQLELDAAGQAREVRMRGDALVRRERQSLGAEHLELARRERGAGPGWSLVARTHVVAQTIFGGAPGLVRADALTAELDAAFAPLEAEALGRVSFEGQDARAEAHRAVFSADAAGGRIELHAPERGKARLSQGRTRVAAETIVTDPRGDHLVAERRVEAGLLPETAGTDSGAALELFDRGEAIHFVSDRLEARDRGNALEFLGGVRGWQGERNLSARELRLDQRAGTIAAVGEVTTRMPRVEGVGTIADDFVQIGAERLDYEDAADLAVYSGGVHMRLSEGWLDSQRVEVAFGAGGTGAIAEIRAFQSVQLEFHRSATGELEAPITGQADRAVYRPAEQVVRLIGDQAPTTVQRPGKGGGTTSGRVLAYRLDQGTLEVDSGEQGPASIRTAR